MLPFFCVGALFNFVKTAMRRKNTHVPCVPQTYLTALPTAGFVTNPNFLHVLITISARLHQLWKFDFSSAHRDKSSTKTMMQIVNIYIYIPNLLNFILVRTCHLILCVFFRSFCQVIAAARQAGGLALERQVWDALPCRLGVAFRSRD